MSWSSRRASVIVAAIALLGTFTSLQLAAQQARMGLRKGQLRPPFGRPPTPPPKGASGDPTDLGGITVTADESEQAQLAGRIRAAQDNIDVGDWKKATEILQQLLEREEDAFVPVTRTIEGKTVKIITSIRTEANRLVGNLPPKAMEFYRLTYGPRADELLKLAKEGDDVKLLAEIMSRYLYTDAGAEATDLLATRLLDRGQYSAAALCFEKLIQRQGPDKLPVNTLFRAALAFQRTKDKTNLDKAWKFIERKTDEIKLGNGKKLEVAKMKTWVASRTTGPTGSTRFEWPLVYGDPTRSAQGVGGTAFLEPRWKFDTWRESTTKGHLDKAVEALAVRKAPVLHGFGPLAATLNREDGKVPLMIYRDFWGLHARPLRHVGDPKSEEFCKAGDIYWEAPSQWSIDRMLREPKYVGTLNTWIQTYVGNGTNSLRPEALFENSVIGSLSTDNVRVYAVDDFQVTPYESPYNRFNRPGQGGGPGGKLGDALYHNVLQAYDLDSGKLLWEVGGREDDKNKHALHDTFFLGPPLPLGGKLYLLGDKNQELRLICLDAATGQLLTRPQRLADAREKIQVDNARRYNAAHLAYGEGILVCPTNSGGLLGVDLLTNSLVWAYGYREKGYNSPTAPVPDRFGRVPPPGFMYDERGQLVPIPAVSSTWKNAPPVISQGKVVFTAPDASSVHCLNLRDGSRLWKQPRQEGDVYLAGVFAGNVIIVGKSYARGLSLADGVEQWRVETGMPSGIGIASKDVYYLPLASAVKTHEPEICLIDVKAGRVVAHTHSRKKEVPGNLLFYEGEVLSQSLFQVADYPQLDVELRRVDALLAKNENDAEGRALRGDLRLDKGDLKGAIEDLRVALAAPEKKLPPELESKARTKLYESLTEYFQADFDAAEKYLKEYEALCSVTPTDSTLEARRKAQAEEKKRKGSFWCLVGRGREKQALREEGDLAQKRLLQAFEAYMNFGSLGEGTQELMDVVGDPGVRVSPAVWSKGRISAMVASASAAKRKPLEKLIQTRYDAVRKERSLEALRGFVNTFGSISAVGREARMELAERLIASDPSGADKTSALVDAERHLSLLRFQTEDRQMAGRAVEALARLMTRKGLMDDATYFYQVLGRDFADVVIKDGKTGRAFFNHLATDKRLLLFLGGTAPLPNVKLSMDNVGLDFGSFPLRHSLFRLEQEGERLPYFRRNVVGIRTDNYNQLKVLDREKLDDASYEGAFSSTLDEVNVAYLFQMWQQQQMRFGMVRTPARISFKNLGHLVILPIGHKVFAFDPVSKKKLWDKNLSGSTGAANPQSVTVDPRDGSLQLLWPGGWTQRLGQTGPASPRAVCLQTPDGLVAVDPVDGHLLWKRTDIPKRCHLYNDAEHVFVVEVGNDGTAGTSRVFRLHDGGDVRVKDFSAAYQKRARILGHNILYSESDSRGVTLHLYDVLAGKDRWSKEFATGSFVLRSEAEGLGGVVEPDGKVTVVDLEKAAVALQAKMRPEHLGRANADHPLRLLRDRHNYYIACDAPADAKVQANSLMSNLLPGSGLRALPINGMLYSFNSKGETNWFNEALNQMILLDEFAELPMVVMASRYNRSLNQVPGQFNYVVALRAYDKQTGKLILDREDSPNRFPQFHSLIVKPSVGQVELQSYSVRLRFNLYARATPGGGAGPGTGKTGSAPLTPPPPPPGRFRKLGAVPGFQPQFARPLILTR